MPPLGVGPNGMPCCTMMQLGHEDWQTNGVTTGCGVWVGAAVPVGVGDGVGEAVGVGVGLGVGDGVGVGVGDGEGVPLLNATTPSAHWTKGN